MPLVQLGALRTRLTSGNTAKMLGAAASGLVDGMLIEKDAGEIWLVKNIVGAILPFIGIKNDLIDGFSTHSLGNATMILVIALGKRSK